jgi:hypothetical protein
LLLLLAVFSWLGEHERPTSRLHSHLTDMFVLGGMQGDLHE